MAGSLWVGFLALEPYVRRRWPWRIISWNRLLAGRFRDPMVGRDVLIGSALGTFWAVDALAENRAPEWLGLTPAIPISIEDVSLTEPISYTLVQLISSLNEALSIFLVFFLLVFLLRREWVAITITGLLVLAGMLWQGSPTFVLVFGGLRLAAGFYVALRFGVLPLAVGYFVMNLLILTPITYEFSAWYAANGFVYAAVVVTLAFSGFLAALDGRPLFRDTFFPDS
jgi:serine/threonine-protein kinase